MPAQQSPAAGAAGGFNAVQKLLTNRESRHVSSDGHGHPALRWTRVARQPAQDNPRANPGSCG